MNHLGLMATGKWCPRVILELLHVEDSSTSTSDDM